MQQQPTGQIEAKTTPKPRPRRYGTRLQSTLTHLVSGQACAKHRPHNLHIYILRQHSQIGQIQDTPLLKAAVTVVQVVDGAWAVLLAARGAEIALVAHRRQEADADGGADLDGGRGGCGVGPELYDAADAFMAADVREFDVRDGLAVWARGGAACGVEVYWGVSRSFCLVWRGGERSGLQGRYADQIDTPPYTGP